MKQSSFRFKVTIIIPNELINPKDKLKISVLFAALTVLLPWPRRLSSPICTRRPCVYYCSVHCLVRAEHFTCRIFCVFRFFISNVDVQCGCYNTAVFTKMLNVFKKKSDR